MSKTVNELSQIVVTVVPKDTTNTVYTPTTARYRVDDCRSGDEMVDWTTLTPSTSMEITVPGSVNTIKDTTRLNPEAKIVTVNTDNGLSTEQSAEYEYRVKNLGFADVA